MTEQDAKIIFWDRHEAALLIDLCAQVSGGKVKRTDGIARLSKQLRCRAALMGRKVGADFRNDASVSSCYSAVEYLMTDGMRGEPGAAPIFASVYRTYVAEPDEFKNILDEAKRQCRRRVFNFDTHEVIKLIEASVKFSSVENINEAVEPLSVLLQDYAKRRGVEEGDTSRDVPSIVKRMAIIDGLRRGRQVESAAPREVFLVKLCKNDPEKFHALLAEANRALGVEASLPPPVVLADVLKNNFPGGFRYGSSLARKQFRRCLSEPEFQNISDEQLIKSLREITFECGEKLFLPYTPEQSQLIDEIKSTVNDILARGYSCVYADKVFEHYSDRLSEVLAINSVLDMMERFGWDKNILTRGTPDINADVQKFYRESARQINFFELAGSMWFIPFEKLKTAVIASPRIICVKASTYIDLDAFPIDDETRDRLEQFLRKILQASPSLSLEECRRSVSDEFPSFGWETKDYTMQGFSTLLRGLYGSKFAVNRHTISLGSEAVSKRQLFVDFCNERESFTLDELQAYADEISSQIEFKSVRRVAIRVSIRQFVRRDQITFDVKSIDAALDGLIEDCRSIKSLAMHFDQLPPLEGHKWNEYVLESYLFCFSEEFELINSVFSKISWGGAAGRKSLHLAFEDVAEKILSKSKRWRDRESALDLLVSEKILLRRAFKDIDEVIRRLRAED